MSLLNYLKSLPDEAAREVFASRCETSLGYLRQIAYGNKPGFSEKLAIAIERESAQQVTCEELRPDVDWGYIRGTAKAMNGGKRKAVNA